MQILYADKSDASDPGQPWDWSEVFSLFTQSVDSASCESIMAALTTSGATAQPVACDFVELTASGGTVYKMNPDTLQYRDSVAVIPYYGAAIGLDTVQDVFQSIVVFSWFFDALMLALFLFRKRKWNG